MVRATTAKKAKRKDLREYDRKRDFHKTSEPAGKKESSPTGDLFVVQKHAASRLHFDFRLELDGVLKSWAVPKGPSMNPADKRLAMHVEDHPLAYADFEGVIPKGEYGGGTVMLWDTGRWTPHGSAKAGYAKGELKFELEGEKLHGRFALVRMKGRDESDDPWLLIKDRDEHALDAKAAKRLVEESPSVRTGRSLEEIAAAADRVWRSNRAEQSDGGDGKAARSGTRKAVRATKAATGSRSRASAPRSAAAKAAGAVGAQGAAGKKAAAKRKAKGPAQADVDPAAVPRAKKARQPALPKAQLATLVDAAPAGAEWLHEIKFDGYRILAVVAGGKARLISRNGKDWTDRFPGIAAAAAALGRDATLDGEIVALNAKGVSDFQALQGALDGAESHELHYYVFDLPWCGGFDLTPAPLGERKRVLAALLDGVAPPLIYSDHVVGGGEAMIAEACRLGLEGIISKRVDAPYEPRRSKSWLKSKCIRRQEFVVGGWTDAKGSRSGFGALLIGYHDDGDLRYAGKVGAGFDDATLKSLRSLLDARARKTPPFADPPGGAEGRRAHWVRPDLVVEVEFFEWTKEGALRHPTFKGRRTDKAPEQIVRETAQSVTRAAGAGRKPSKASVKAAKAASSAGTEATSVGATTRAAKAFVREAKSESKAMETGIAGVRLTSPDKVLYPEQGATKADLAQYYETMAEHVLRHVGDRPLTLVRCPEGRSKSCFYQKHATEGLPESVQSVDVSEKGGKREPYIYVRDVAGLIGLVQIGALELHPWGSRIDALERPDVLIFDLDPGPGVGWPELTDGARAVKALLEEIGLRSFIKTSGKKGLHVSVPIARRSAWDEAKDFTHAIARRLESLDGSRFVAQSAKAKRKGRIFVDYLRNARGATHVAAYSTRTSEGATVSMPVSWEEIDDVDPRAFDIVTAPRRVAEQKRDPWADFGSVRQSITKPMKRALGME